MMLTRETEPNSEARQIPGLRRRQRFARSTTTWLPGHPPGTFCRLVFECCILFTGVSICVCVDSFFSVVSRPQRRGAFLFCKQPQQFALAEGEAGRENHHQLKGYRRFDGRKIFLFHDVAADCVAVGFRFGAYLPPGEGRFMPLEQKKKLRVNKEHMFIGRKWPALLVARLAFR